MNPRTLVYLKLKGMLDSIGYAYVNRYGDIANAEISNEPMRPGFMIPTGTIFKVINKDEDLLRVIDEFFVYEFPLEVRDLYIGLNKRDDNLFAEIYVWYPPTYMYAVMAATRFGADRYFKPLDNAVVEFTDTNYLKVNVAMSDGMSNFNQVYMLSSGEEATELLNSSPMAVAIYYNEELMNYLKNNEKSIQKSVDEFQERLTQAR